VKNFCSEFAELLINRKQLKLKCLKKGLRIIKQCAEKNATS